MGHLGIVDSNKGDGGRFAPLALRLPRELLCKAVPRTGDQRPQRIPVEALFR